ncbi:hypothetical protein [Bacteroides sp. 519]|uniref:hypothetical protein n=1 Tax=Bacteroides sp. 519 TaxID=2302937 RepID=UPI0013D35207|nr:hypothetical protein [Bacteroides sp. 519]NDV59092.1 hypothetical protein [Bacteroides sp. 519]
MPGLNDDLRERLQLAKEKFIVPGSIYRIIMGKEQGITPDKLKRFVIIGCDDDNFIGFVVVNSEERIQNKHLQYPLFKKDYDCELDWNSFVDCSKIRKISKSAIFKDGEHLGNLNDIDKEFLFETVKCADTISNKEKKKYNLI